MIVSYVHTVCGVRVCGGMGGGGSVMIKEYSVSNQVNKKKM